MPRSTALVNGYIRAEADSTHPLQTKLSLIITDFEPNGNKQAIPVSEKQNIISYAVHMPLKINFDGNGVSGHVGAIPIGPITSAYESTDNGRDVIAGEAVVWNEIYDDIADHLKVAFAEGIGTSWEIYYESIETDSNDIQWLQGCVFAGTCIVHTPAYGPSRTRVLAIAEKLNTHAEELERLNISMANSNAEANVETLQTDLSSAMDVLSTIYTGLWEMFDKTYEIEQSLATTDMPSMAEKFTKLIAAISKQFTELQEKAGLADAAQAELTELKEKLQQIDTEKAEAELLSARKNKLAEAGIEITDARKPFYLGMSEEVFTQYITDLLAVKGKSATASLEAPIIPEPSSSAETPSVKEIAAAFLKERGK
jgi:hypothetical protein